MPWRSPEREDNVGLGVAIGDGDPETIGQAPRRVARGRQNDKPPLTNDSTRMKLVCVPASTQLMMLVLYTWLQLMPWIDAPDGAAAVPYIFNPIRAVPVALVQGHPVITTFEADAGDHAAAMVPAKPQNTP